jgi:DNA repair protein RadC
MKNLSDLDLLSVIVGERDALALLQDGLNCLGTIANESIVPSWSVCETAQGFSEPNAVQKVAACFELVSRIMGSKLKELNVLDSPATVSNYLKVLVGFKEIEQFVVLFLDAQNQLIESRVMFQGTLNQTSVYPREVVRAALALNASAVIFAHNHPSGCAEPSRADQVLTQALKSALMLFDIAVLDHLIVSAAGSQYSFARTGLL